MKELPENLLRPTFYLSEDFTLDSLKSTLKTETEGLTNWITGSIPSEFEPIVQRLRKKGIQGPLWEYLNVMRRFAEA
jgi:hypothetical protein